MLNTKLIRKLDDVTYEIDKGFVPNMNVPGKFYVNEALRSLVWDEIEQHNNAKGVGGFLPAVRTFGVENAPIVSQMEPNCFIFHSQ